MLVRNFHRLARCVEVSTQVRNALEARKPVVALESTIISHGMPHPHNAETALAVEQIIREQNAIPATIAIIKGKLKVGLSQEEIQFLAAPRNSKDIIKTSRRDIPYVMSQGLTGGTTVAGTIVAASSVGIPVFATGGLGGVHRGGEQSLDISADLTELGRSRIAVVCGGIKSILDIGRSLEYLETQGVCVATYGSSKYFPAFYCRRSKHSAPYQVGTPEEAAALIHAMEELQLNSGVVFAVPVPNEFELIDDVSMEKIIESALKIATEKNITGKAVTPFVLEQITKLTGGRSLQTNIALVKNNAVFAAKIAVALSRSKSSAKNQLLNEEIKVDKVFAVPRVEKLHPVVIGGSVLDSIVSVQEPFKVEGRTLKGHIRQSGGGVGRNLADALGKMGVRPKLVSTVGNDLYGRFLLDKTVNHLDHSAVLVSPELPTASYTVLLDQRGEFRMGVGDMDIHSLLTPERVSEYLQDTSAVIIDGNIPSATIEFILDYCYKYNIPLVFEPTDAAKATIPFRFETWKCLRLITPNVKELRRIAAFIGVDVGSTEDTKASVEEAVSMAMPLAEHIQTVMVTLGALGVVMVGRAAVDEPVTARYYATSPLDSVSSVNGAGDCLAAGVISGLLAGKPESQGVFSGLAAAFDSLHCYSAVPPQFTSTPRPIDYSLVSSTVRMSL